MARDGRHENADNTPIGAADNTPIGAKVPTHLSSN
jgi:hypothetical protein